MTTGDSWDPAGQHMEFYKPTKTPVETARKAEAQLLASGWIKPTLEGKRKYNLPDEFKDAKFFSQVEIIGQEDMGVFLQKGQAILMPNLRQHCRISFFENWNYGKKNEKPFWQVYFPGR